MRIAAIDIGTNTILMIVADISADGNFSVVRDEHHIARLGKGVDSHGNILPETFDRVRDILLKLKELAVADKADKIIATGTSSLRDAKNSGEFLDFIRKQLSINIKILTGIEEANLTYIGAISDYLPEMQFHNFAVLDIGGGSTELVIGKGKHVISSNSVDIGSVRLTERILKTSPPSQDDLDSAIAFVRKCLNSLPPVIPEVSLIGVAGTLTTSAAIDLQLSKFNKDAVNRHVLMYSSVDGIFNKLAPLTLQQIRDYPQIHPDRADIILAGIIILREFLSRSDLDRTVVSTRGLRYGIICDYIDNPGKY